MKSLRAVARGALLALLVPSAVRAGGTFTATTTIETSARRPLPLGHSTVRGWVDGDRGKIEFADAGNRATPEGDVLLTTDGGKTIRYFDLERKECHPWTRPAARESRAGPGSPVSTSFKNVRVEKTLDEPGPVIAGLPTRHVRLKSEYDTVVAGQGSVHRSRTAATDDLWVAERLRDPGFAVWLTTGSPGAEGGDLGAKLDAALSDVPGTPLKRVTVATVAFDRGKPVTTTTAVEVTRLRREKIAASTFAPPLDCARRTGQGR